MRGPPARHPNDDAREQLPAPEGIIGAADELKPGDRVVYPNQGVCAVVGWEVKDIAGQKLELVRMTREEDGAAVMVPKGKVPSIGLRRVATGAQMEGVFHYLGAVYDDPELDWKVRHRDNADRLIAGGVLGVAEVVKGLHSLSRLRPLPTKEREQYDNARHLLVHEVSVSLGVPPGLAEDYIDYALMPPAGVKFDLKPPPAPVPLPSRPKKRRVVEEAEEGDLGLGDLGLGDLGIDLEGALEGAEVPGAEAEGEGAEGAEAGEGEAGGAEGVEPAAVEEAAPEELPEVEEPVAEEDEAEEPPARAARPAKPARVAEKPARVEKPEKAEKAAEKKAARAPKAKKAEPEKPARAEKHAEKPSARKAAAEKAAPAKKAAAKKPPAAKKAAAKKPAAEKPAPKRGGKKK
ncbi:transcriptional regulator, CarD family [Anaeromyxobacter dehalogenans 2CP-1]|uniref:Transcriptional regulator, CarD family n=1 Tax=Anaeromyxobacter dehalogenans (strain ATCC BAA-258 / DSM 21875 / 2CP-1) TaxID=455488 RepID=B8JFJ6_ANAD2|nr:CarD family transcriptional regulator [Anaeromyxobacter dehalogenans]ACL66373.1 transcriptional regulator, CarD family [Anaeromyxobacter dehalogenans 2CP-1]